jgi:starch synthase
VPIVRATGGLADTVQETDPGTGQGLGFVFEPYDRWMLFATIVRALEAFRHPNTWRQLQLRGMRADFSWERSAQKYVDLYHRALASRIPRPGLETYQVRS